jgi:hypothetical protein
MPGKEDGMAVRLFSAITLISLVAFSPLLGADEELTAEGTGMGITREEALISAKRNAVEKGIGTILLSQTEIENFQMKKDQIITKTVGTVKKYEVISESQGTDGAYTIKIKALLSRSALREDLAAFHVLIESMNKPRVMVIIAENNIGNEEPTNQAAENAVITFLRDPYEFDIIDPQVVAQIKSSQQQMAEIAGNPAEAASIGASNGAEVVITGNAVSREAKGTGYNMGGMVSVQADVTLKAINCTSARIIGTASGRSAKVHINQSTAGNMAIEVASKKAVGQLLDAIIKEWQNQINNGITLSVSITGVTSFRRKNDIVNTLRGVGKVRAVRERGWDNQSKRLQLDIQYLGDPMGFCNRVDGFKLNSKSGEIAVTGVTGLRVSLGIQ